MIYDRQERQDATSCEGLLATETSDFPGVLEEGEPSIIESLLKSPLKFIENTEIKSTQLSNKISFQLLKSLEIIKETTENLLDVTPNIEENLVRPGYSSVLTQSLESLMKEIDHLESIIKKKSKRKGMSEKPEQDQYIDLQRQLIQEKRTDLEYLAFCDPVTQLPNRRFLESAVRNLLSKSSSEECSGSVLLEKPSKNNFYVIFIDIDDFKQINDTYGHEYGDILLQAIAQRLKNNLRGRDIVGRYGGDEFVALVHHPDSSHQADINIEQILTRLMGVSKVPYKIKNKSLTVTLSFGVAEFPNHGDTIEKLLSCADKAMYSSKESGKNTCTVHPPL